MLHLARQIAGRALELNVFVHLVIAGAGAGGICELLVAAERVTEEAEIPAGEITAVIEPAIEKPKAPVDVKPLMGELLEERRCTRN